MKKHVGAFMLVLLNLFVAISFAGTPPSGVSGLTLDASKKQYVRIANHADFNISETESFTVSCWVKIPEFSMFGNERILSKRYASNVNTDDNLAAYELKLGNGKYKNCFGNNVCEMIKGPSSDGFVMSKFIGIASFTSTWYHICMVIDRTADYGNGSIYLYQDGVQSTNVMDDTKTLEKWVVNNSYDMLLGCVLDGNPKELAHFLNGEIADVRFWKRALTSTEVKADMTAITPAGTGLVAAYNFKNMSGTTVPDISGKGHHGTLVNFPIDGVVTAAPITQNATFTGRGNTNEVILQTAVRISGSTNVALTNLKLGMTGTTAVSDVTAIKVYSTGTTDKFDSRNPGTATLLGTITNPAVGVLTCDLSGKQLAGGLNYLWVTYDVADNAVEGNQLDAELVSITTAKDSYSWSGGSVDGARTILLARKLLFDYGDNGSVTYRIPAIVTAANGDLVTATDNRKFSSGDLANDIDVVVKRSKDGGKTWLADQIIAQGTAVSHGYGDAALVRTGESGGLLCIFAGGNGLMNSTPTNLIRTYICKSTDNGATWTSPIDITDQLYGSGCTDYTRSRWYASFCGS
ncbi:MAG: LamG-like jellyroll fold domain-containing protein, partial [Bacteroidaceae bacterium]